MTDNDTSKPPNPRGRRAGDRRTTGRRPVSAMWYVLAFLVLMALGNAFFFSMQSGNVISYSEFKTLVRQG